MSHNAARVRELDAEKGIAGPFVEAHILAAYILGCYLSLDREPLTVGLGTAKFILVMRDSISGVYTETSSFIVILAGSC
jgi:hypothetical protein